MKYVETARQNAEEQVPRLQRLFENIWFLLAVGVLLPTIVYTAWSVYDLVELPYFPDQTGALSAGVDVAQSEQPVGGVRVGMKNLAFRPERLVVQPGTTVTWVNDDPFPHAVASGRPDTPEANRLFASSGDFPQGESFSFTFDTPGEHAIYCSTPGHFSAGMQMTVVVEASQ